MPGRRFSLIVSLLVFVALGTASAQAAATKVVRYHGFAVRVPASWPVYDLSRRPEVCVRFNRHAVYLGVPRAAQRCPAHAAGRTESILLAPARRTARSAGGAAALRLGAHSTSFSAAGVAVSATWGRDAALLARALGRRLPAGAPVAAAPRSAASAAGRAHAAAGPFTGLGFDACSTPSQNAMSAWSSSSYRAIGVYIGGANEACSQPNLTSSWVSTEIAAGWHLILTYVGLQAPSNSCGCASISPGQASAEGTAAANDAVSDAQAVAIPAGNPIYFDMEAYSRGGSNTSSVLSFLSAWTSRLHALGYQSGVYSSGASGMTDLVNARGTSFVEPDEIWFAEWNGAQNTSSAYVPDADWSGHQRIHQYDGGHNETHGGVTINIDGDAVDAATANTSSASTASSPQPTTPPSLGVTPTTTGITNFSASWPGATGVIGWRVLGGQNPAAMGGVGSAHVSGAVTRLAIRTAAPYYAVQALGTGNQVLATSPAVSAPAHLVIYGQNAFVPGVSGGIGGLPVGCYTGQRCLVSTTLSVGRTTIARTGPEYVGSGSAGIVYFRLTPTGTVWLLRARGRRLTVRASVRDSASGQSATTVLKLIPFFAGGHAAPAHLAQSPTLKIVGLTDFVYGAGTGGILAGCMGAPLCPVTTTVSVGRTVIARTGPEMLGANELGYLIFKLTPQGHALLAHARGNRLPAQVTLATTGTQASSTTANVSLVAFR